MEKPKKSSLQGESSPHNSRVGDNQSSCPSWCSYIAKIDKRSINGVPVRPASAKEMPAIEEKRNPKKARISQHNKQDCAR
jgi:hypothetical protein